MGKQALEGKRLTAFGVAPEEVTVVTDPAHPLFDKEGNDLPIDAGMVASIDRHGVQLPAIVWKDGNTVLLVDGRQRRKNTIEVNRLRAERGDLAVQLPIMVFRGTIEEAAELMETLNELRRENSPMVRARRVLRMTKTGRSESEVAALLGKSVATIQNWLKLHDCSAKVQRAVEAGEMSVGAAVKLTKLPRAEQDAALSAEKATAEAIAAESVGSQSAGPDEPERPETDGTPEKKTRAPRTVGPKRTAGGAVTKGTLRKVYERACSEEFENSLTDGERKILGWGLGKLTTEQLARECPGIMDLLGVGPVTPASPDEALPVEADDFDEDDTVAKASDEEPADLVDAMEDAA